MSVVMILLGLAQMFAGVMVSVTGKTAFTDIAGFSAFGCGTICLSIGAAISVLTGIRKELRLQREERRVP